MNRKKNCKLSRGVNTQEKIINMIGNVIISQKERYKEEWETCNWYDYCLNVRELLLLLININIMSLFILIFDI